MRFCIVFILYLCDEPVVKQHILKDMTCTILDNLFICWVVAMYVHQMDEQMIEQKESDNVQKNNISHQIIELMEFIHHQ